MPVKKSTASKKEVQTKHGFLGSLTCHEIYRKFFYTFLILIMAYALVLLATMIRNNLKQYNYIGQSDRQERTITLSATGKVTAKPDIAATTMGVNSEGDTVAEAQNANTKIVNNMIDRLKGMDIDEKDIQTSNYNIYPVYDYTEDEGRVLRGYSVNQNVTIKIRDLDKVSSVIGLAGQVGANNVGGLSFTIDDKEVYLEEARADAMEKIANKAKSLRDTLGVDFVSIVSYNEYSGNGYDGPIYEARALDAGIGGGGAAPSIESGSTDVSLNVSIVFEIK